MLYPFFAAGAVSAVLICLLNNISLWWLFPVFIGCTAAAIVLYFIVLFVHSLFINKTKPQKNCSRYYRFVINFTISLLVKLSGTRLKVNGLEKLPESGKFLIVGNHISNFDPMVTIAALQKYNISYITKPENLKIPIAGSFIYKGCFLPIDRENDRKALRTIIDAIDLIKRDVCSIGVYPEGTRNKSGEGLLPFRNGCFKIAQKANVPIVVVTTKNTPMIAKNFPFRPTKVELDICEVISAEEAKNEKTNDIGDKVREIILKNLGEIR